ncbi:13157_t:CDS:2, partial [Dentiscutata heterogama]
VVWCAGLGCSGRMTLRYQYVLENLHLVVVHGISVTVGTASSTAQSIDTIYEQYRARTGIVLELYLRLKHSTSHELFLSLYDYW